MAGAVLSDRIRCHAWQVNMRKCSDHSHTVEIKYPSLEDARRRCVTAVSTRPSIEAARKPKFITQQN
jgi:hypothetical protein